ncbi:hypothetical protein YC2023_018152 [Brassica napus]
MSDRFWTRTRLLNTEALNNWANDKDIVYVAAGIYKNKSLPTLYVDANWFGSVG